MDYGYILKRAWNVTWRHKILWVFGIFIMAGGSSYSPSSMNTSGGGPGGVTPEQVESVQNAGEQLIGFLPILIGIAVLIVLLAIVWWVLSIAAQGALIYLANEAEEGREVRAGAGWRMGFRFWGRVFLIYLLLFLPVMVIGVVMGLAIFFSIFAGAGSGAPESIFAMVMSVCGIVIVGMLLLIVVGFIVGLLALLGTRYAVLEDVRATESIRRAWSDVKTRFKDVFLMWLITFGIGIAWGMAVGIVSIFFGIAIFVAILSGAWPIAVVVGLAMFLLLLIPNAIYSTYLSALWTVFFRQMTGRDAPPERAYPVPPGGQGYPAAPVPAAPGVAPAPPAPTTPGVPPPPRSPGSGAGLPPTPSDQDG